MWPLRPGRHDDYAAKNRFALGVAMPDQLNALYSEFLEVGYDYVDWVVWNAYFSRRQSGGLTHVVAGTVRFR